MATGTPIAASRFSLSIDGVPVASFSELQGITTSTRVAPKKGGLLTHELAHALQQTAGSRNVKIFLAKPESSRTNLQKLRISAHKQIKLTAYNQQGTPALALTGTVAKVETDVLQQEWSITYETIQRVL
jgi:hypothetical protein